MFAKVMLTFKYIVSFIIFIVLLGNYKNLILQNIKLSGNIDLAGSINNILYSFTDNKDLGILYVIIGALILLISLALYISKSLRLKKIAIHIDKYEKNYLYENCRASGLIATGMILMGISTIVQELYISIILSIIQTIICLDILYFKCYEADRALFYYYNDDSKIIYIYRSYDKDTFLCGIKKSALSCNYYIVMNKKDIFEHELYLVDKKSTETSHEKSNIKKNNNTLCKIIKNNIVIMFFAVIFTSASYFFKKSGIVWLLLETILIVSFNLLIQKYSHFLKEIILNKLSFLKKHIKLIAEILYLILLGIRIIICNKLPLLEWMLHLLVSSMIFKHLISKKYSFRNKKYLNP